MIIITNTFPFNFHLIRHFRQLFVFYFPIYFFTEKPKLLCMAKTTTQKYIIILQFCFEKYKFPKFIEYDFLQE